MMSQAVILCSSTNFVGSSAGTAATWVGGRTALVIDGTTFGAGSLNLQILAPTSGQWLNVGSSILSRQMAIMELPTGQYRMVSVTSSAIGIHAALITIPV